MSPIINESELPAPRLELRWDSLEHNRICAYNLVLPLREFDIRREDGDGNQVRSEQTVTISKTQVSGPSPLRTHQGATWIDAPFRDSAHAQWDSELLKFPIYAVAGGKAQLIERRG